MGDKVRASFAEKIIRRAILLTVRELYPCNLHITCYFSGYASMRMFFKPAKLKLSASIKPFLTADVKCQYAEGLETEYKKE